jgi:hypothetical protein
MFENSIFSYKPYDTSSNYLEIIKPLNQLLINNRIPNHSAPFYYSFQYSVSIHKSVINACILHQSKIGSINIYDQYKTFSKKVINIINKIFIFTKFQLIQKTILNKCFIKNKDQNTFKLKIHCYNYIIELILRDIKVSRNLFTYFFDRIYTKSFFYYHNFYTFLINTNYL